MDHLFDDILINDNSEYDDEETLYNSDTRSSTSWGSWDRANLVENMPKLYGACFSSDINKVRCILEDSDIDVNEIYEKHHKTPLMAAIDENNIDIVNVLLEDDRIDINTTNKNGDTPLHFAIVKNSRDIVKLLLEDKRINVNLKNSRGETPFHCSCVNPTNRLPIVYQLMNDLRVDVTITDHRGKTPFMTACESGNLALIKSMLDDSRFDPNLRDNSGKTGLFYTSGKYYYDNICELLDFLLNEPRIDVNLANNTGMTPFMHASWYKNEMLIDIFIKNDRVDIHKRDNQNRTVVEVIFETELKFLKVLTDIFGKEILTDLL